MDESARQTKIEWREWGADAFAEASDQEKPLLLSLSANWCSWCHEMDETTYSRPTIAANVNERFVPVRVDVDRRPRVRERYNMGGFPSTVFATPDGDIISGATYLGVDEMRQVLERIGDVWEQKGGDAGRLPRSLRDTSLPAGDVSPAIEAHITGQLGDKFDDVHGGWGDDAKFPLPRTVEFALKREREQAFATLTAVREHLFDNYDGGFFRYATGRDWSDPHREKLLSTNAAVIRAFANAYLYSGSDDYRTPAEQTIEYLTTTLWTGDAFAGSQAPRSDDEESTSDQAAADALVDETVFANANAMAVDALLTYAAYTDDDRAATYAERALSAVADDLVSDGAVTHYRDGDETGAVGLLSDQAHVVRAFVRAAQVLGGDEYVDQAQAVADHALETIRTGDAFIDGPATGPGLLDRPLPPIDDNAEFADALVDLHALTGDDRYLDAARDAVAAFAGATERLGVQVAGYATAAARIVDQPLRIEVAAPAGSDLHRAALRVADHEKVVVPAASGDDIDDGCAYVHSNGSVSEPAGTPVELSERIETTVNQ